MPLLYALENEATSLRLWHATEPLAYFLSNRPVQPKEEVYWQQLKTTQRQKEFVVARYLLSTITKEQKPILKQETGKPYVPGSAVEISITHAFDRIGIMVAKKPATGIDVERIDGRPLRIAKRFLSPLEYEHWRGFGEIGLTLCWSIKETVFKWLSRQGVDYREQISIKPLTCDSLSTHGSVQVETPFEVNPLNVTFVILHGYVLTYL